MKKLRKCTGWFEIVFTLFFTTRNACIWLCFHDKFKVITELHVCEKDKTIIFSNILSTWFFKFLIFFDGNYYLLFNAMNGYICLETCCHFTFSISDRWFWTEQNNISSLEQWSSVRWLLQGNLTLKTTVITDLSVEC